MNVTIVAIAPIDTSVGKVLTGEYASTSRDRVIPMAIVEAARYVETEGVAVAASVTAVPAMESVGRASHAGLASVLMEVPVRPAALTVIVTPA